LGRLKVSWRSLVGEVGSTSTKIPCRNLRLSRNKSGDFSLFVLRAPAKVFLEIPFTLSLQIVNHSTTTRELVLILNKDKMSHIMPFDLTTKSLGVFGPNQTKEVTVTLLPLGLGVQSLGGFRLSCLKTNRSIDMDSIHTVVVEKRLETMSSKNDRKEQSVKIQG